MKHLFKRAILFLLVATLLLSMPLQALASGMPPYQQKGKVYTSEDGSMSLTTDVPADVHFHSSTEPTKDEALPDSAVPVEYGDGYTVYEIQDAAEMAALLEQHGVTSQESEATHYDVEDEAVTVMVTVDGSQPLVQHATLGLRLGAQAEAASVRQAQAVLLREQQMVYDRICNVLGQKPAMTGQYTVLANGFALEVMASQVPTLAKVPGVRTCCIAPSFTALPDSAFQKASVTHYYEPGTMVGAEQAWENGYTGQGMVIGIIDTGITVNHNAFATIPEVQTITAESLQAALDDYSFQAEARYDGTLTAADLYYSGKIAFQFDYSESDTDVSHGDVSAHGTHVAGIAAGHDNLSDDVRNLAIKGTAYDAQLAVFKVFSGESASFDDVLAAMEDAILLGLDAVNLSLGATAGGTYDEGVTEIFDNAMQAGINVLCAAGNEADAAQGNRFGFDMSLTRNVDKGVTNVPGNYAACLSVASLECNNYPYPTAYLNYGEPREVDGYVSRLLFYDTAPDAQKLITVLGGASHEMLYIPGYATEENLAQYDIAGKLVLISEDRFGQTVTTQQVYDRLLAAGAIGIILASEDQEDDDWPADWAVTRTTIPLVFAMRYDLEDYVAYFRSNPTVSRMVYVLPRNLPVESAGEISDFSAWGTTPDLTIKPEITAVGGWVYSAYGPQADGYAVASGTSMATPQVAGGAVLVRQYLEKTYPEQLAGMTPQQRSELIHNILMSTAVPVEAEAEGLYWPVRAQGAGFMNLSRATSADAYLTVDGGRPKVELGDDPQRTGQYILSFSVTNLSETPKTYDIRTVVQTEGVSSDMINGFDETFLMEGHSYSKTRYFMNGEPVALDAEIGGDTQITVPAGQTVSASVTIALTQDAKAWLGRYYTVGGYVEGFIFLDEKQGNTLSLPFLGFYGDWSEGTIMDNTFYWEVVSDRWNFLDNAAVSVNSALVKDGDTYNYLGNGVTWNLNPIAVKNGKIHPDRNYISPNGDGHRDGLEAVYTGQMRYAQKVRYAIVDAATGEIYYEKDMEGVSKNYVDSEGNLLPTGADAYTLFDAWYGTDANGKVLPDGSKVLVTITFTSLFLGEEKEESWEFPIYIDTEAPKVSIIGKGGDKFTVNLEDQGMLCSSTIVRESRYGTLSVEALYAPLAKDLEANGGTFASDTNTTTGTERILVSVCDYAGNSTNLVAVFNRNSVNLSDREIYLLPGECYEIHNQCTFDDAEGEIYDPLSWVSSNPEVATVTVDPEDCNHATITAVANGTVQVTATRLSQTATDTAIVHVCAGVATITATMEGEGSVWCYKHGKIPMGESDTYRIEADWPYVIADVLVDGVSVGPVERYTFTNETPGYTSHTIHVRFALETFPVRFLDWDGTVLSTQDVPYGEAAEAPEAPTRPFHTFLCWDRDFSKITSPMDVQAVYIEHDITTYYAIAIVKSEGGTVTGPTQVLAGEDAVFTMTPDADYQLVDVLVDGESVGPVETYTFQQVDASHFIQAVFHTHVYTVEVTPPTCTEEGYSTYTCTCGDSYVADQVPALGHQMEVQNAKVATCTEDGYTGDEICIVCSEMGKQGEIIQAHGHKTEVQNAREVTCTEDGYTGDEICTVCGERMKQGELIRARGHQTEVRNVREATCTEDGYTGDEICTVCGEVITQGQVIPAHCPSGAFCDLDPARWYHAYTDYVIEHGIMHGMGYGRFCPNSNLTRGQLVTTLYRLAGEPAVQDPASFADVQGGAYYAKAVAWAENCGIAQGMTATRFAPDHMVTREQAAVFLYRYVAEYLQQTPVQGADLSGFRDGDVVSDYAQMAVAWAVAEGFLEGYGDGLLGPQDAVTRAQMAKFLTFLDQKF